MKCYSVFHEALKSLLTLTLYSSDITQKKVYSLSKELDPGTLSRGDLLDKRLRRKSHDATTLTLRRNDDAEEINNNNSIHFEYQKPQRHHQGIKKTKFKNPRETCSLPKSLVEEIQSYANVTQLIIDTVTKGVFKGKT
ncbi:unnamed protein product, partial [Allacma fusca]